jgi:hypothetical protein
MTGMIKNVRTKLAVASRAMRDSLRLLVANAHARSLVHSAPTAIDTVPATGFETEPTTHRGALEGAVILDGTCGDGQDCLGCFSWLRP